MAPDTRKSTKQIFSYIRTLAERRFTIGQSYDEYGFSMTLADIPNHPSITLPCYESAEDGAVSDIILTVEKVDSPDCPKPPVSLAGWLEKGWDDPTKALSVIKKKEETAEDGTVIKTEIFTDDKTRYAEFVDWNAQRDIWVEDALPAYRARRIYEQLYALYSELGREKDRIELMMGDGLFETALEDGTKICHPVVLERVMLSFDADVPSFTISDCDANPSLYSRLLRIIPGLESTCLSEYSAKVEDQLIHPFDRAALDPFLAAFCNSISSECKLLADGDDSSAKFTVRHFPVLFTRSRDSGYSAMLDKIIEDIETTEEFSPSLVSIIGQSDQPSGEEVTVSAGVMEVNGIDSSVLLEKSANREQLLIAKKLEKNPAVLVQGPPGTGKTHTISNIIGDLLSKGQSVLVTSQTSKALSVLRDKISEPIRPLCVSVLDDNRKQLEDSLNTINDYMSSHNIESLDYEADKLDRERTALIDSIAAERTKLVSLVTKEYSPIEIDDGQMLPKDAAKYVRELEAGRFIPDDIPADAILPFTTHELSDLYASNESITASEEAILSSGAPDISELPKPSEFTRLRSIITKTDEELEINGVGFWNLNIERGAAELKSLCDDIAKAAQQLSSADGWMIKLAQSGVSDASAQKSVFQSIGESIPALCQLSAELKLDIIDAAPSIPDELITPETQELFDETYEELDDEKINWLTLALHPRRRSLLDKCIINGEKPDTKTEVGILARYHRLLLGRKSLVRRWSGAVGSIGGPELTGSNPEEQAQMAWTTVRGWLDWYAERWGAIADQLTHLGFDLDRYIEKLPLEARMAGEISCVQAMLSGDLLSLVEEEYYRGDRSESSDMLSALSRKLLPYTESLPIFRDLRTAVESGDSTAYTDAYERYDRICLKRDAYALRCERIDKLSLVMPMWANEIKNRAGINGGAVIPGDLDKNILGAKLRYALCDIAKTDIAGVQAEISKLEAQLSGLTRELISRRAWSAELRTMLDQDKKRALATWAELVKRVGKGTGKRAEQLLASGELRQAMKACRRSVPVWIMPLGDVAEYFDPSDEKFDVLIIDEASQADLTGLIALYLAKKVIVVGDDKQVSPTPIGVDVETSTKLRQEFLSDIPAAAMYDEMTSIYDLGKANYEPITLKEHFRCATDIINFSNYYTYNGIIRPLRDSGSITLRPATLCHQVKNAKSGAKKTNRSEAESITALICACIERPEYKKSTFGVITMLGDEQALLIDRMLREKLSENVYKSRHILCGNPSYFQGDERDVIFISLVDTPNEKGGTLTVRREGYNEMYAKRYNVAASRAKDQMWVVHSLNPDTDLKTDDIRLKLIKHAENPQATAAALEVRQPTALSSMEEAVVGCLKAAGFECESRVKVGSYTVSIICSGGGKRVAIECDGDIAADNETIMNEMTKQSVLERLGWKFIRLRSSEYYRDPEGFISLLPEKLEALGVKKGSAQTAVQGELCEKVKARAAELIDEWKKAQDETAILTADEDLIPSEDDDTSKPSTEDAVSLPQEDDTAPPQEDNTSCEPEVSDVISNNE